MPRPDTDSPVHRHVGGGPLRVAVLSGLHPALSADGTGIAGWQLYDALRSYPGTEAFFIAGDGGNLPPPLGTEIHQPFGVNEYICASAGYDSFFQTARNAALPDALIALLARLRPDVVHVYDFENLGVEVLLHVRRALPEARILLTLHPHQALCPDHGLIPGRAVARQHGAPTGNDLFLREMFVKRFLGLVDVLIAPTRQIADRFIAWGMPAARMHVVHGGLPQRPEYRPAPEGDELIIGFFGPPSGQNGIGTLLEAMALLSDRPALRGRLRIEIHGDAACQPEPIATRLGLAGPMVALHPPCDPDRIPAAMQACHAVVLPAVDWAQAPRVIQQAFACGRPVLCPDVPGITDYVRNGTDGLYHRSGSAHDLAHVLGLIAQQPERLAPLRAGIEPPPLLDDVLPRLLALYAPTTAESPDAH